MPFRSEAQRRYLFAKHPDVAREFAAATPKGTRLPEHVKKAHAVGAADALAYFKLAGEELRLKIPSRTFHGFEAAKKTVAKSAGNGIDADALAEALNAIQAPRTPGDETRARDPLDRTPAWGAPSNLSGGDAGSRVSDLGQPTHLGGI